MHPKSRIDRVNPALVQDNHVLALSVNRQEVEQSTHFIREYGLLTPPVVGQLQDGTCRVLAGEREFLALRELGSRTAEAVVFAPPQRGRMLTMLPVRKLSDTMATKRERNGAPLFVTIC